jgi:hypothetical protein
MVDDQMVIGPIQAIPLEAIHSSRSISAAQGRIGTGGPTSDRSRAGGAVLTEQGPIVPIRSVGTRTCRGPKGHAELLTLSRAAINDLANQG